MAVGGGAVGWGGMRWDGVGCCFRVTMLSCCDVCVLVVLVWFVFILPNAIGGRLDEMVKTRVTLLLC